VKITGRQVIQVVFRGRGSPPISTRPRDGHIMLALTPDMP
jgi:hypothetical protein